MPLDPVAVMDSKAEGTRHVHLWTSHPAVASPPKAQHPCSHPCHPCAPRPRSGSEVRGLAVPTTSPPPDVPTTERGVALNALLKLGAGIPRHLTTAEVVEKYVVPATASRMRPYASLLPADALAPPAYLVIHSWAAPFHHLLSQLRARFQPPHHPPANPHLWLDCLALLQHAGGARTPRELATQLAATASLAATTPVLLSLGPHAEVLSDLTPLHALAALTAAHRAPHLHLLTARPPALPHLLESFVALDITAARAPTALDRRAMLDAVAALAAPSSSGAPAAPPPLLARAADPAAGAAAGMNPLLQRVLIDRVALCAAARAEGAATTTEAADCRFLQAAMALAGPRVGPRGAAAECAEALAAQCLALRVNLAHGQRPGSGESVAALAGLACARYLVAEAIRQREGAGPGATAAAAGGAGEGRLGAALRLLEEAAGEMLGCRGGEGWGAWAGQQAARALVAAAEVCNTLCRHQQAQDLAARALGLLAATATAEPAGAVQPADRAAANAALGHALLHQGDPNAALPPLAAAAEHHAAAAPLPTSPAPYCRRAAPALRDYSAALLRLGRLPEATHWARRALAAAEAAHGPEDPTTADCMETLALTLLEHHCPSAGPPSNTSAASNASSDTQAPATPPSPSALPASPFFLPSSSTFVSSACSRHNQPQFFTSPALPHPLLSHPACSLPAPPLRPASSPPLCGSAPATTFSASSTASTFAFAPPLAPCASAPLPATTPATPPAADPRCAEAEELLRRRLRVMLQHHGKGHAVVVRSSQLLAQALHRTRQHAEAEAIYLGVLQSLREALPALLPSPATTPRVRSEAPVTPERAGPEPMQLGSLACSPASSPAGSPMAAVAAEASWGSVEVAADAMLLCGEAELAGMKTLLGGARSSSSTLDEALWRADHDTCTAAAGAGAGEGGAGAPEACPARPRLADVLRELAGVYDDWGRPADAELCRRQASALMPQAA